MGKQLKKLEAIKEFKVCAVFFTPSALSVYIS